METNKHIADRLRIMGCRHTYKPVREIETEAILLAVRHPAGIIDGRLVGSMIDLYDHETFRVWTSQTKKAKANAARHGLRIRLLDGECELFIPAHLADELLREFGAKVKRILSDEHRNRLRARGFKNKPQKTHRKAVKWAFTVKKALPTQKGTLGSFKRC